MRQGIITIVALLFFAGMSASAQPKAATNAITQSEAEAWGKKLEADLEEKGGPAFTAANDFESSVRKIVNASPGPDTFKAGFLNGVHKSASKLEEAMNQVDSYTFLRAVTTNSEPYAVFRLLTDGALNYHFIYLARTPTGRIRGTDLFIAISGERYSETVHRGYLAAVASTDRSLLDRLTGRESDFAKSMPLFLEMTQKQQAGDHAAVLKSYASMPATMKTNKMVLLFAVMAAMERDQKEYLRLIETYERTYPKDPSLNLVSIDGHVLRKDFRKAIKSIRSLSESVGGDPYLRVLAAGLFLELKEDAEAVREARMALMEDPKMFQAFDVLAASALGKKDYPEVAKIVDEMQTSIGTPMRPHIEEDEEYAPFLKSEPGKAWLKKNPPVEAKPKAKPAAK